MVAFFLAMITYGSCAVLQEDLNMRGKGQALLLGPRQDLVVMFKIFAFSSRTRSAISHVNVNF